MNLVYNPEDMKVGEFLNSLEITKKYRVNVFGVDVYKSSIVPVGEVWFAKDSKSLKEIFELEKWKSEQRPGNLTS